MLAALLIGAAGILLVLLKWVFPGEVVLPQSFSVANVQIHYYGLILGLAVLSSYFLARRRAPQFGVSYAQLDNIVITLIIGGFIGARVYHIFSSWDYYWHNPLQMLAVWNGGLSIFGAIIGGLVALVVYRHWTSMSVSMLKLLDWLTPSVVLGQIIGRFGNLFNYEAYGVPTNLPWKMFVPQSFRLPPYEMSMYFHPLFLYEALAGLLILAILLNFPSLAKRLKLPQTPGILFWLWLALYGLTRLITETLRVDSPYLFGVKQNLLAAGLMVLLALIMLIKAYRSQPNFTSNEPNYS